MKITNQTKKWTLNKIPPKAAYYIVGFSDGEGSFNISFRKRNDYFIGWKITPVFNISQKEKVPLSYIKKYLKCGTIRQRKDNVFVFEVTTKSALINQIIPFFEKYPSISNWKKQALKNMKKIILILDSCKQRPNRDELNQILKLRNDVTGTKPESTRVFTDNDILTRFDEFEKLRSEKV